MAIQSVRHRTDLHDTSAEIHGTRPSTAVRPAGQLELAAEGSTSREEKSPNRVLVEVDEPVRRSDTADGGTRLIIMADRGPRCIAAAHRPGRLLAPHRPPRPPAGRCDRRLLAAGVRAADR